MNQKKIQRQPRKQAQVQRPVQKQRQVATKTTKTEQLETMNGDPAVVTPAEKPSAMNKADNNRQVVIIHFNTPELTKAAILSLRKHGGEHYAVTVFDNSDKRPFVKMDGVKILDNTKGKIINFDKELAKFPDKCPEIGCAKGCIYGSAKHMMTVQKLWDLYPGGFVLMESDILLQKSIEEFFRPEYSFVAHVQNEQPHNPFKIGRVMPLLCWMNVPMLKKEGALYFDPKRSYGIVGGGRKNRNNWYDTGSVLLEDVIRMRPRLKALHIDVRSFLLHYTSGSWAKNGIQGHLAWLNQHKNLWQ